MGVCVCVCVCVCVYVYIYIYICEYYSDIKKDETIKIVAMWKDPEIIILRDVKQMD